MFSVTACKHEYRAHLAKYRNLIKQKKSLEAHIRNVINRLVRTGTVNKGRSPGRLSVSEEVADDLRQLKQNP